MPFPHLGESSSRTEARPRVWDVQHGPPGAVWTLGSWLVRRTILAFICAVTESANPQVTLRQDLSSAGPQVPHLVMEGVGWVVPNAPQLSASPLARDTLEIIASYTDLQTQDTRREDVTDVRCKSPNQSCRARERQTLTGVIYPLLTVQQELQQQSKPLGQRGLERAQGQEVPELSRARPFQERAAWTSVHSRVGSSSRAQVGRHPWRHKKRGRFQKLASLSVGGVCVLEAQTMASIPLQWA